MKNKIVPYPDKELDLSLPYIKQLSEKIIEMEKKTGKPVRKK